ncbi:MAG: hypothetical protein ACOZNI_20485 [Myxococcota bacterium]
MNVLMLAGCIQAKMAWQKVEEKVAEAKERASIPPMECDAPVDEGEPVGCISGTLRCGDVVEGTTEGGDDLWDDPFYARHFCFPAGDDYGGPERVYRLEVPANQDVTIRLDSDCVDLDVAALAWDYAGKCPTVNHNIPECESTNRSGGGKVRLNTFKARDYLVVVDGKKRETGTFRLTVQCKDLVR